MTATQAESVIKNIIKEICLECSSQGTVVSETLAAFMVKAAVLDPDNELDVERTLTKTDVQRLIKTCVDHLLDSNSPALDTVKMQVHFEMNYSTREEFLHEHHLVLAARLLPIVQEIVDARARTRDELEGLYRKIVSYVLLCSGLGLPTEIAVVREATAALQSVFPQTELGTFMALTKEDKEKQLKNLSNIVAGIRLFNRDCGKGGEGIDDLPLVLRDALQVTSQAADEQMAATLKLAYELTGVLLHVIESPHTAPSKPPLLMMKQCLIFCRQHEAFIKVLMHDILFSAEHLDQLERNFKEKMNILNETVQSKSSVPTAQVYPLFIALSQYWSEFQDEILLLSVLNKLITSLGSFGKNAKNMSESPDFRVLMASANILTDEQRQPEVHDFENRVNPDKVRNAHFLFPENTKNFYDLPLEFKGYCGYVFTVYDRFLLPANPNIGVLYHKGKYYAFSSKEAAVKFADNPDEFLTIAVNSSKKSPEVIQLLDMHTHFSSATPGTRGGKKQMMQLPITKCDTGTQTDTHFIESNIVASYEWNEWELRRKAIKLANLRHKITHSVQTDLSHYKRENQTQSYELRSVDTQTKQDGSSNVPKPSTYIAGLRGQNCSQKVDLTLKV